MRKQADWVLLEHAAPTLAGIKTASMFRLKGLQEEREAALCAWREVISARGISVAVLQEETESALVYVTGRHTFGRTGSILALRNSSPRMAMMPLPLWQKPGPPAYPACRIKFSP